MEKIVLGELQHEIDTIIGRIGSRSFLRFLKEEFEEKFNFKSDAVIQIIESIITQYFEISSEQLYHGTDRDGTDARRAMVHFLKHKTTFDDKSIKKIVNISRQTYSNYLTYLNDLYNNKGVNPPLVTAINKIDEIFKINQNGRYQSNTAE